MLILVLAALALWLLSGCQMSGEMPNSVKGSILGLLAFGVVFAVALAVRKVRENDAFCTGLQEKQVQRKQRTLRLRREFVEHRDWPHEVPEFTVGPLESLSEPATEILPATDAVKSDRAPIPPEDLRRIVSAMVVETCEARELVRKAQKTLSVDDYGDMLVGAERRLHLVIGCLGGLLEQCPGPTGETTSPEWPSAATREEVS